MFSLANDFSKRVHPAIQFSDDIFFDFWVAVAVNARKGIFGNVF
jgi:hypothetical protein